MKMIVLLIALHSSSFMYAQENTPVGAFLEKWENSKNYLLEIVEAMPEANFSFKPTEREMTFSEQLIHIKDNMDWLSSVYFTSEKFERINLDKDLSKSQLKALLVLAFDNAAKKVKEVSDYELKETVDFFSGAKSRLQILNLLQDHVTHHRGQLIVYLNLNGIEPPRYVGW